MQKSSQELASLLDEVARKVEPKITEVLELDVDKRFQPLARYQVSTGGKRLRPALCVITCRLFGGRMNDALYPAAGLEILHNDTLLADDIIDHSEVRRNKATCWAKFGKSIAECMSIDYSASVFQAAGRTKKPEALSELFARTMKSIVDGEILDILFEQSGREEEPYLVRHRYSRITDNAYIKMVSKKTAVLLQASCQAGAIVAGASQKQIERVGDYGFNLGIAFQVQDDILDIFGEQKKFGKQVGGDFKERKLGNIVILSALKELNSKEAKEILKILRGRQINKRDIQKGVGLIKRTAAREKASKLAEQYARKAGLCLDSLPQNKWNDTLAQIADFVIKRET